MSAFNKIFNLCFVSIILIYIITRISNKLTLTMIGTKIIAFPLEISLNRLVRNGHSTHRIDMPGIFGPNMVTKSAQFFD